MNETEHENKMITQLISTFILQLFPGYIHNRKEIPISAFIANLYYIFDTTIMI